MTKKKKLLTEVDARIASILRGTTLGEDVIAADLEDEGTNGDLTFEQQLDLAIDKAHEACEAGLDILRNLKGLRTPESPNGTGLKMFTVVGFYEDNNQRYCDTFEAKTPDKAEKMALAKARAEESTDLLIAGVFEGELSAVL